MGASMRVQTHMLGSRRIGQFVDLKALNENETVQESISKGYVVGKLELIVSTVKGVIRSMCAAVSRDGNGRKIDGIVSIQPSISCKLLDSCEPVSKDNVTAKLRARVLKEGQVDTSDWSFVVEGATSQMDVTSITTGEVMGEIVIGEAIDFNGSELNLPTTATITWTANDGTQTKSGSIAAADRTCTATRITTVATVLSSLTGDTWEGKLITFVLRDGTRTAIKSATLRVAE